MKSWWINDSQRILFNEIPIFTLLQPLLQKLFKNKLKGMKHLILILHLYSWQKNIKKPLNLDTDHHQNNKIEEKQELFKNKLYVDVVILAPTINKYNCFIVSNHLKIRNINYHKMWHCFSLLLKPWLFL